MVHPTVRYFGRDIIRFPESLETEWYNCEVWAVFGVFAVMMLLLTR